MNSSAVLHFMVFRRCGLLGLAIWTLATGIAHAEATSNGIAAGQRLWKAVPDEVYLQEIGEKVITDKAVTSVAIHDSALYAVVGENLKVLRGLALEEAPGAPKNVRRLRSVGGSLWAATENGAYRFASGTCRHMDTNASMQFG